MSMMSSATPGSPDYHWLAHEVERLREENAMLRKERDRIWEEAHNALVIERKLRDLLTLVREAQESKRG